MIDWNADGLKKISLDDLDKQCSDVSKNKKIIFRELVPLKKSKENWRFSIGIAVLLFAIASILYIKFKSY